LKKGCTGDAAESSESKERQARGRLREHPAAGPRPGFADTIDVSSSALAGPHRGRDRGLGFSRRQARRLRRRYECRGTIAGAASRPEEASIPFDLAAGGDKVTKCRFIA
jgi:hypothetical protein